MTLDPRKRRPLEGIRKDPWLNMGQEEELGLPCDNMDTHVAEIMADSSTTKCWAWDTPDPENHTNEGEGPHYQGKTLPFPHPKSQSPSPTREIQLSAQKIKDAATPPLSLESTPLAQPSSVALGASPPPTAAVVAAAVVQP